MVLHCSMVSCRASGGSLLKNVTETRILFLFLVLRTAARRQSNLPMSSYFLIASSEPTSGHFGDQCKRRCILREFSCEKRLSQTGHRNLKSMTSMSASDVNPKFCGLYTCCPKLFCAAMISPASFSAPGDIADNLCDALVAVSSSKLTSSALLDLSSHREFGRVIPAFRPIEPAIRE